MYMNKNIVIEVIIVLLVAINSDEGAPIGRNLGKRSMNNDSNAYDKEILTEPFRGNAFKDAGVIDTRLRMVKPVQESGYGVKSGKEVMSDTLKQRLLQKEILASFPSGKRPRQMDSIFKHGGTGMDDNSLFGKMRYRYRKRGREHMMAVPDAKASARAAFMQARRRMGPEFNPTGW